MTYEEIFEPIDVIASFQNGAMHPLRFKWKKDVYRISQIHSRWTISENEDHLHHFTVAAGGPDSFELIFNSGNLNWQLARVALNCYP